jgi:hypothetical protein
MGSALSLQIGRADVRDQRQEELEPGSVGGSGVELDGPGKQCCSIKALKALSLAFSRLSCSILLSSCYGFAGLRLNPQLVMHLALLVTGIATPLERRAQVARSIARTL